MDLIIVLCESLFYQPLSKDTLHAAKAARLLLRRPTKSVVVVRSGSTYIILTALRSTVLCYSPRHFYEKHIGGQQEE